MIDSSALVAVLLAEPGWEELQRHLEQPGVYRLSAVTLVEAAIVVEARLGMTGRAQLDMLLRRIGAEVRPVDAQLAATAIEGWRRYGRGRHQARLNFGDCFSYALAAELGEELLFVGNDFAQTDVVAAMT
ncbi:MAG: type II toxin-antitoxin system VapC family toxin [Actinomycetia bacterium]|nr:type II toxin-antitoxin system VapC family toxin [Actinomycetes bacterium]